MHYSDQPVTYDPHEGHRVKPPFIEFERSVNGYKLHGEQNKRGSTVPRVSISHFVVIMYLTTKPSELYYRAL